MGLSHPELEFEGPAFEKSFTGHAGSDAVLEVLRRDGIVRIRGAFDAETLNGAIQDFEDRIKDVGLDPFGHAQIGGMGDDGTLRNSLGLSRFISAPIIRTVARGYLGPKARWSFWRAYRLEPLPPKLYRAFQPHVDGHLHELKAMVLLSPLEETQQCMMYWRGTHKIDWKVRRSADTVFGQRLVSRLPDPFLATGEPGDIILFDTNGIHAGQRNMTARRDTSVANFSATAFSYPVQSLNQACVAEFALDERDFYRVATPPGEDVRSPRQPPPFCGDVAHSSASASPVLETLCEQAWEERLDRVRAEPKDSDYLRGQSLEMAMIQAAHGDLNLPQFMDDIERIVARDRAIGVVRDQSFSLPTTVTETIGGGVPDQKLLASQIVAAAVRVSGTTETDSEQFRLLLLDMSICIAEARDRRYLLNSLALASVTLAYLLRFPANERFAPLLVLLVSAFAMHLTEHRD